MHKTRSGSILVILIISILTITSSCKYQKLLKSDDYELKLETAIKYFEKERYSRSISLLNSVLPVYRGTQKAETVNYYFAMAHYKQGDYVYASHLFVTFHQTFPRSEHAEEFFFLSAYCKYLLSPNTGRDQTPTLEAIQQFQRFINRYPQSAKVEEANNLIDELRLKLEKKAFDMAMMYYRIKNYNAAATSFKTLIVDFPDIKYREEAMFYAADSYFKFAENSIFEKQQERYELAVDAYNKFIRAYPESKFKQQADEIYRRSSSKLKEIKLSQTN
ncbi:MAG: outer membrane protein assembly factor BamD [Bacteroidetes bacterium]|nr:outer membrane protein assembly factor BamD [Bacteroidota bacterium]